MRFNDKEKLFNYIYDIKKVNLVQVLYENRDYKIFINACFTSQMCDSKAMAENFINALDSHYHFLGFKVETYGNEDFVDLYIDLD